jgi:rhodanese-related sulfurtransferase
MGMFGPSTLSAQQLAANPWNAAQVAPPNEVAAMLQRKAGAKPVILQVGFAVLYRSEHIPGSMYAGPASTPAGLQTLKQAVAKLPKNTDIYLYCGCCPMSKCPNIRPAFEALRKMGYTHLHVVALETSFGKDWVAHGYPVATEAAPAN